MKLTTHNSGVSASALIGKVNSNGGTIKSVEILLALLSQRDG